MSNIHVERAHTLGLDRARSMAHQWMQHAERKFELACRSEETPEGETLFFSRSGISGQMVVSADRFVLDAKLGFLLSAFRERIQSEMETNFDKQMAKLQQAGGPGQTA